MKLKRLYRNVFLSMIIANVLILIGKDQWLLLYKQPRHYLDMLMTFLSVFIVFEYVEWVQRYLNRTYRIAEHLVKRIIFQLLYGLIIPALLAILFTFMMWEFVWHKGLVAGGYFKYEFFPQVLLIIVVNLFLILLELFQVAKPVRNLVIIGQKGKKKVPIPASAIAFIQLKAGVVYAHLFNEERLIISEKLDALEESLPQSAFFRANRQTILSRPSCQSFESIENGKVAVTLISGDRVVVSQKRAAGFRAWIN